MDSEGLGYVKPQGLGCVSDAGTCCTSVWHLNPSAGAYVCWKGRLAPLRCEVKCMLGRLRATSGAGWCSHGSGLREDKGAVSSDDLRLPQREAGCQPSSRYPAGNVPSQLTAGGEEPCNSMSCSERRGSCEASTQCIRLPKLDVTHASSPYASP